MAIMRGGPVGTPSGRLGGAEFAIRGGKVVLKQGKSKRSRVSRRTIEAQGIQAEALQHWEALTDVQKLAWETVTSERLSKDRFGAETKRTGRELFLTIPHDFRFGAVPWWQDVPPTRVFSWSIDPLVAALTTTVLIVAGTPTPWPGVIFCHLWAARMTKDYYRSHRGWFKVGPVMRNLIDPFWNFTPVLAAQDIVFLSGEQVALKAQFWQPDFWPQWQDFGVHTVP